MILPTPPSGADFTSNPKKWAQDFETWARSMNGTLESTINALGDPAKASVIVTGSTVPLTTLNVGTDTLGETQEFLAGLVATMKAKGLLRAKVGAS